MYPIMAKLGKRCIVEHQKESSGAPGFTRHLKDHIFGDHTLNYLSNPKFWAWLKKQKKTKMSFLNDFKF